MSTLHYLRTGQKPVIQQLYAGRDENTVFFWQSVGQGKWERQKEFQTILDEAGYDLRIMLTSPSHYECGPGYFHRKIEEK